MRQYALLAALLASIALPATADVESLDATSTVETPSTETVATSWPYGQPTTVAEVDDAN